MKNFSVAGGSVPGTDHILPGQPGWVNCHDAYAWRQGEDFLIAVVCDGCGGKILDGEYQRPPNSEVGAKIAVRLIVERIARMSSWFTGASSETSLTNQFWDRVQAQVMAQISVLADSMGASLVQVVKDYFMFTFVGILITPRYTYVFGIGDGVYAMNGEVHEIGPFPQNSPPYLMYGLIGSSLAHHDSDQLKVRVHEVRPTEEVKHCFIGTDGVSELIARQVDFLPGKAETVGPLSQFWEGDAYFSNPDGIRRRLAIINRERVQGAQILGGLLSDDTTFVVVRREASESQPAT